MEPLNNWSIFSSDYCRSFREKRKWVVTSSPFYKTVLLAFFCFCSLCTFAQEQLYYFKNNGSRVSLREGADYIRMVSAPDSGSVLYKITDYYPDGKQKLTGHSPVPYPAKFEGQCITYSPIGSKTSVLTFHLGVLVNTQYFYYPNGKLLEKRTYPYRTVSQDSVSAAAKFMVTDFYDHDGKALVSNGNGHYIIYNPDFTTVRSEGELSNGKKQGLWKSRIGKEQTQLSETYDNGILVSGTAIFADGQTSSYTKEFELPVYEGGIQKFSQYLAANIVYPTNARKNNRQGRVVISFIIEKDGSVSEPKVEHSIDEELDAEALRVVKNGPKWIPGKQYGRNVKVRYAVPVNFTMNK